MKKILLLHGVNLNLLGRRAPHLYGKLSLTEIEQLTALEASKHGYEMICFQSNHEGELVDHLQKQAGQCTGIIINPGAFAHYSYALHDALLDTQLPCIEVHLSAISQREAWRQHSVTALACIKLIEGKKQAGYTEAVSILLKHINENAHH